MDRSESSIFYFCQFLSSELAKHSETRTFWRFRFRTRSDSAPEKREKKSGAESVRVRNRFLRFGCGIGPGAESDPLHLRHNCVFGQHICQCLCMRSHDISLFQLNTRWYRVVRKLFTIELFTNDINFLQMEKTFYSFFRKRFWPKLENFLQTFDKEGILKLFTNFHR